MTPTVPVASYRRGDEDSASLRSQLVKCQLALPQDFFTVGHFYDVEYGPALPHDRDPSGEELAVAEIQRDAGQTGLSADPTQPAPRSAAATHTTIDRLSGNGCRSHRPGSTPVGPNPVEDPPITPKVRVRREGDNRDLG